jgi:hypothetical protein
MGWNNNLIEHDRLRFLRNLESLQDDAIVRVLMIESFEELKALRRIAELSVPYLVDLIDDAVYRK